MIKKGLCDDDAWKKACAALGILDQERNAVFPGMPWKTIFSLVCADLVKLNPTSRKMWLKGRREGWDGWKNCIIRYTTQGTLIEQLLRRWGAERKTPEQYKSLDSQLWQAIKNGNPENVPSLISEGADVDYESSKGETALMRACKRGNFDIATTLLENGADVNIKDENGQTALSKAAAEGHADVVLLLLENGKGLEVDKEDNK